MIRTEDATDEQIEALRVEAGAAGDTAQWALCMLAMGRATVEGAERPSAEVRAAARAKCARAIRDAQAAAEVAS